MCGIAGILTSEAWTSLHSDTLVRMGQALTHRGPDDAGVWIDETGEAGFAHTRLSILDLSAAGHQPMHSKNSQLTITFNGEIYNFKELRSELESLGESLVTESDTEVLLSLYARHGASMVSKLRGMFAFCIWDRKERKAFFARDPFGIKPVYIAELQQTLVFASELRALRKSGLVSPHLNASAVALYFETGSVPEPLTLLRDVTMLPAGTWMEWCDGKTTSQTYWQPRFHEGPLSSDPVETTREAILDSLRAHFVSDVPVGIFLSAGIDSTVLVALSKKLGVENLSTFSVGSADPDLDESQVAEKTASHFNTHHITANIEEFPADSLIEAFLQKVDQPTIDGLNTYMVSALAKEHGLKVVLSGLGADEIFGGYPSFQRVPHLTTLGRLLRAIPSFAEHAGAYVETRSSSPKLRRLGSFLQRPVTIASSTLALRSLFSRREALLLAQRYTDRSADETVQPAAMELNASHPEDQISEWELTRYMRNQLLRDSDVMSMAHSLELRVPFVDRNLFEAVASLPHEVRIQRGKKLLTDAVPELPTWVLNKTKRGFVLPFDRWLQAEHRAALSKLATTLPNNNSTWHQLWSIFVFERWLVS
jgi:asparagine synthase (glutamine-hydrolysing)